MASLAGTQIKNSYTGLLKTTDNSAVTLDLKRITDGAGASSALQLSSREVKVDALLVQNVSETSTLTRFLTWDDTAKTVGFYDFTQADPAVSVATATGTATVSTGNNAANSFTVAAGTGLTLSVSGTTITLTNSATVGATVALDAANSKYSVTDTSGVTKAIKLVGAGSTTVTSAESSNTLTATISSLERNVTKKEFISLTSDRNLTADQSGSTLVVYSAMNTGDGLVLPTWQEGLFYDIIFATTGGGWSLETKLETDGIFGSLTIHSGAKSNGSTVSDIMVKSGTSYAMNHSYSSVTCFKHFSTTTGRPNKINFKNSYNTQSSEQLVGGITGSKFSIMAVADNNWFIYGDVHSTNTFNTNIEGDQASPDGTFEDYHALEPFQNWTAATSDATRD